MPAVKISELTTETEFTAEDYTVFVDKENSSMSSVGTDRKISGDDLAKSLHTLMVAQGLLSTGTTLRIDHTFTNQTTVTIAHNFGKRPLYQVFDTNNAPMGWHPNQNGTGQISFTCSTPLSGTIVLLA